MCRHTISEVYDNAVKVILWSIYCIRVVSGCILKTDIDTFLDRKEILWNNEHT